MGLHVREGSRAGHRARVGTAGLGSHRSSTSPVAGCVFTASVLRLQVPRGCHTIQRLPARLEGNQLSLQHGKRPKTQWLTSARCDLCHTVSVSRGQGAPS